jgi:hypothetical protein
VTPEPDDGELPAEFTALLKTLAYGTVTYPDGTVPTDPDYQPPAA